MRLEEQHQTPYRLLRSTPVERPLPVHVPCLSSCSRFFSSGKVAMVSGVIFSTGPVALLPLLLEADSPVEDVTFFPQPMTGETMMEQRSTAEMTRGITHCGIAHLSLREWQSPAVLAGSRGTS